MKLNMYAVRDAATEMYGNPMFLVTNGQAVRTFTDEINKPDNDNQLHRHPDHFDLYFLGSFDTDHGTFTTDIPPQLLIRGLDCVIQKS